MRRKRKALRPAFPFHGKENSCGDKIPYESRDAALEARLALRYELNRKGLTEYRCPWCPSWHIGHRKGWKSRDGK
jgi:hypothetical protein